MKTQQEIIEQQAKELYQLFVDECIATFGNRVAVFKIGSFGQHGDPSPCSDLDIAIMLDKIVPTDEQGIKDICEKVKIKASGKPFSDRLSVFWSSYDKTEFAKGVGRFPPYDRLDLIDYGALLTGEDHRKDLPKPTQAELIIGSANFLTQFILTDKILPDLTALPEVIIKNGSRNFSKFILFPCRLMLLLDQPNKVGSNKEAAEHGKKIWNTKLLKAVKLIELAHKARDNAANEPPEVDAGLLAEVLPQLFNFALNRYVEALLEIKEDKLAGELKQAAEKLQQAFTKHEVTAMKTDKQSSMAELVVNLSDIYIKPKIEDLTVKESKSDEDAKNIKGMTQ